MSDPRWPDKQVIWLKRKTPEQIADAYERELYTVAGPDRENWFYEYPEHATYPLEYQQPDEEEPMVNKPKKQGTAWETQVAEQFKAYDIPAGRYPEGGSDDKGDVWVGQPHLEGDPEPYVAVAWKRLVKPKGGGGRRVPDGDATVVIIDLGDFIELVGQTQLPHLAIECKATERLNVTRILHNARRKIHKGAQQ